MSYDYTHEVHLAAAAALAAVTARRHKTEIETAVAMFTHVTPPSLPTSRWITTVLWGSYLGHLVGHLSGVVGKDTAASILKQVLLAHMGENRDN